METNTLYRVLIVSDNAGAASATEAMFLERNCTTLSETLPREAVRTARLFAPSLLILDLNLPSVEVVVLCRGLRAVTNAAILLVSATHDEDEIYEYYLAGVNEHLARPSAPLTLWVKSVAWLVRREMQDIQTYSIS